MPRSERPIDGSAGSIAILAIGLRELRRSAGSPSYRELAVKTHFSASTLSVAASGVRLPSLEVTLAYVEACGGDVSAWKQRWQAIDREVEVARAPAAIHQHVAAEEREAGRISAAVKASRQRRLVPSPRVVEFATSSVLGAAAVLWLRGIRQRR